MIDFFEIIGLLAACITTASFLPQVFKTYKTKDCTIDSIKEAYENIRSGVCLEYLEKYSTTR